ncbi:MAG TPA: histone deacetylase, partial [Verrucomicrobiota bacterium]|nr:histone deacetylase [Verrucomicrobiota bacterium]
MKIITDERCAEYAAPGHPEKPFRILRTIEKLRNQSDIPIAWTSPGNASDVSILRAHSEAHLRRLHEPGDFDSDTPNHPDIVTHARRSAGAAIAAGQSAKAGQPVFSLMRPPGHHAKRDDAMGVCYLNNVAIAVLEALELGFQRVAVFDFDVHHGNGTEAILLYHPHAAFFSVHQHPCYPGTGAHNIGDNCFNYPVPPLTPREDYRNVLSRAL